MNLAKARLQEFAGIGETRLTNVAVDRVTQVTHTSPLWPASQIAGKRM
jgi:hypothetical protein